MALPGNLGPISSLFGPTMPQAMGERALASILHAAQLPLGLLQPPASTGLAPTTGIAPGGEPGGGWAGVARQVMGTAMSSAMAASALQRQSIPMLFPQWDLGQRYPSGAFVAPVPPPPDAAPPAMGRGDELFEAWAGPGARLPHVWVRPRGAPAHAHPLSALDTVAQLAVRPSLRVLSFCPVCLRVACLGSCEFACVCVCVCVLGAVFVSFGVSACLECVCLGGGVSVHTCESERCLPGDGASTLTSHHRTGSQICPRTQRARFVLIVVPGCHRDGWLDRAAVLAACDSWGTVVARARDPVVPPRAHGTKGAAADVARLQEPWPDVLIVAVVPLSCKAAPDLASASSLQGGGGGGGTASSRTTELDQTCVLFEADVTGTGVYAFNLCRHP